MCRISCTGRSTFYIKAICMCTAHVEFSMHNITISKNVEFCKTLVELVVGGLAKKKDRSSSNSERQNQIVHFWSAPNEWISLLNFCMNDEPTKNTKKTTPTKIIMPIKLQCLYAYTRVGPAWFGSA